MDELINKEFVNTKVSFKIVQTTGAKGLAEMKIFNLPVLIFFWEGGLL